MSERKLSLSLKLSEETQCHSLTHMLVYELHIHAFNVVVIDVIAIPANFEPRLILDAGQN